MKQYNGIGIQSVLIKNDQEPVTIIPSLHHLFAIDVSGSMYSNLPDLRRHLKNKLLDVVGQDDTVTLIWFSGKNQAGILQEGVKVKSLSDLNHLHSAIDKFLVAQCLTGFKEPLQLIGEAIGRLKASMPDHLTNVIFMTDGYDNQWSQSQILAECEKLAPIVDSSTFIEYGWYCNRDLMGKMADSMGGSVLFAEHQEQYELSAEAAIQRKVVGGKRIKVELSNAKYPYVFAANIADKSIVVYTANNNEVLVPEGLGEVFYFTNAPEQDTQRQSADLDVYAGLYVLSQRMHNDDVFSILANLGDPVLAKKFVNCFSKQDYSDFGKLLESNAFDPATRFPEGYDPNCIPAEDAFTVLDLLAVLESDPGNLIYPLNPAFGYKRIGKATEQKSEDKLKFKYRDMNEGFPVNGLVFNEDRANVSMRIRYTGTVELPKNDFDKLPNEINTFQYRNYTIIKDGIVHTRSLPVSLTQQTIDILSSNGVIPVGAIQPGEIFIMSLDNVPVINRATVKGLNAGKFFGDVVKQNIARAEQKVYKFYREQYEGERQSVGFGILYGEDAAEWLKSIGITDYNGFNPPSTAVKSGDVYTACEFTASIKGISSLPTVKAVIEKIDGNKKLTPREAIMEPAIKEVRDMISKLPDGPEKSGMVISWLKNRAESAISLSRTLTTSIAKAKFAVMVGKGWFDGLAHDAVSYDVNGYTVVFDRQDKEFEI